MERTGIQAPQVKDGHRERQRHSSMCSEQLVWWVEAQEGRGAEKEQAASTHSGDQRMCRGCQCHGSS